MGRMLELYLSDGFGVATDPEGLEWSELLKLVQGK